jgi:hypothetical protein
MLSEHTLPPTALTPRELASIAYLATGYLANLGRTDGRFVYLHDGVTGQEIGGGKYNVLRHAGCVWVINLAASSIPMPKTISITGARALEYLLNNALRPSPRRGLCIVYQGSVKLGANALTLLALLSYADHTIVDLSHKYKCHGDICEELADHILHQIDTAGAFTHIIDYPTGLLRPFRSEYYDGQAIFALMRLLARRPALSKLRRAKDVLHTLIDCDHGIENQVHWMMYAAEAAFSVAPDTAILRYADKLARSIIENSAYRNGVLCTPIACRSEALVSYLRLSAQSSTTFGNHSKGAYHTLIDNLLLQLKSRLGSGAFSHSPVSSQVRIDYLQHNISAFLGLAQVLNFRGSNQELSEVSRTLRYGRGTRTPTPTPNQEKP